jgi:hypothetical protein
MKIFWSESANGFYPDDIYTELPEDAREIPHSVWKNLLAEQANGRIITTNSVGIPISVDPLSVVSLDELKDRQKQFINSKRNQLLSNGFVFDNEWFDCDEIAISRVIGTVSAVNAGIPLPPDFTWRTKYNSDKPMTAQKIVELGATMMAFVQETMKRSWELKDFIDSRTSKIQVTKIDWDFPIE